MRAVHFADYADDHPVTRTFRERRPELVSLARRLELVQHVSAPLDEVLARIWEELAGYQSG